MTSSSSSPSIASCADGRPARAGDAIGAEHHLVHHAVVDRGEELLLRPDVVVERALAETVDRAQLRDAGGVVALPREHLRRGVDDHVATAPSTSRCVGARRSLRCLASAPTVHRCARVGCRPKYIDWSVRTEGCGWTSTASTARRGRHGRGTRASAGRTRACSPTAARASSSTTSAARCGARAPTPDRRRRSRPRSSPRGGAAIADTSDVATTGRRAGARRRRGRALRTHRRPDQQRRHHPLGGLPGGRRRQPRAPPRRARRRFVQHHPRRVAAHGRRRATAASS